MFFLKYYIEHASVCYCPNSVIILLSFLWLPFVLQPSKETFALWSYGDWFSVIRSITAYNYLSFLSSLIHGRFSVVTQRSFHCKRLCSRLFWFKRRKKIFYYVALVYCVFEMPILRWCTSGFVTLLKVGSALHACTGWNKVFAQFGNVAETWWFKIPLRFRRTVSTGKV